MAWARLVLLTGSVCPLTLTRPQRRRSRSRAGACGTILTAALILGSCGVDEGDQTAQQTDWGPLAVIEGPPNPEDALISGALDITEECVTIVAAGGGRRTTLAWPSEATDWNAEAGTISYIVTVGDDEKRIRLASGDEVSLGGGHKDASSNIDWLVQPDSSCPGEGAFYVGDYSEGFESGP